MSFVGFTYIMAQRIELFRLLNGLISVYKPPGLDRVQFYRRIKTSLADAFNSLPPEPKLLRTVVKVDLLDSGLPSIISVPDIVDDDLALGRRFLRSDFLLHAVDPLEKFMSGIQVFGIGEDGVYNHAMKFEHSSWLKTYHLTCMLGRASTDGTASSPTLIRSRWRHVKRHNIDRVLVGLRAQFSASSLLQAGLRPNSQAAYVSLAKRWDGEDLRPVPSTLRLVDFDEQESLISPWERALPNEIRNPKTLDDGTVINEEERRRMAPYVNSLECIHFDPPFFILEIQVAYETLKFLIDLVANLGPKLRTTTLLSKVRRVKHGHMTVEQSLLLKHCVVPVYLIDQLEECVKAELEKGNQNPEGLVNTVNLLECLVHRVKGLHNNAHDIFTNLYMCSKLHPFYRVTTSKR